MKRDWKRIKDLKQRDGRNRHYARQTARLDTMPYGERNECLHKKSFSRQSLADSYARRREQVIGYVLESYPCKWCSTETVKLFHVGRARNPDRSYVRPAKQPQV
jgi:hypothetical protein